MSGTIPFPMPIVRRFPWNGLLQCKNHVRDNVGIGVFVYCYACRCMRDDDDAYAFLDAAFANNLVQPVGYIDKLGMLVRLDRKFPHGDRKSTRLNSSHVSESR